MKMFRALFLTAVMVILVSACGSDDSSDNAVQVEAFQQEVAKSLVLGLAKGVGSEVGGDATGWVLGKLGGSTDTATADAIQEVGTKIDKLSSQIADFKRDVDEALNKLYTQGEKIEYTSQVTILEPIIANAKTIRDDFVNLTTHVSPDSSDWQTLATQIDNELDIHALETDLATIQQIMSTGDPDGALELWGDLTMDNLNSSNAEECYMSIMNQFQRFYLVQADLLNFIIEKAHKIYNDPNSKAVPALQSYRTEMLKQAEIFLNQAERVLTSFNHSPFEDFPFREDWHMERAGSYMELAESSNYQSPHLGIADEIVAQAMGWENSLTIRLAERWRYEDLQGKTVVLVNEATGQEFSSETYAQTSHSLYADQVGFNSSKWVIKRLIFKNLPEGRYHLKDIYADYTYEFEGGTFKFLHDYYLSHVFTITTGSYKNMLCEIFIRED